MRWTGPKETDMKKGPYENLIKPVPPERWPYGPPDEHEYACLLHSGGLYYDCSASAAEDE